MHRSHWIASLVTARKWTHGAEIGVAWGKNLIPLMDLCPHLHMLAIDAWAHLPGEPAYYASWDHEANYQQIVGWADPKRVKIIRLPSLEAAATVEDGSLDFVFIDANHETEAVRADIRAWRPKVKPGGLLGHDIDWPSVRDALAAEGVTVAIGPDNCWSEC